MPISLHYQHFTHLRAEKLRFWKPIEFVNDYKLHTHEPADRLASDVTYGFVEPAKLAQLAEPRDWNYSHAARADGEVSCPWLNVDNGGMLF